MTNLHLVRYPDHLLSKDNQQAQSLQLNPRVIPFIDQRALIAGLEAEAAMLRNSMDDILEAEAKRKKEEIKARLAAISIQVAHSKAREKVYVTELSEHK